MQALTQEMMTNKEIRFLSSVEEIDPGQWNALVEESAVSTFFQTKRCYDFYASLSFMDAFAFGVSANGCLKGVLVGYVQKDGGRLKQFFSRRAVINGGALLAQDISDVELEVLLEGCVRALRKAAIFVETRNFHDYSCYRQVFEKVGFTYKPHYNFHVDTSSQETVDAHMGKSRKRDVKTSLRDGAEVIETPTLAEVKELYGLLVHLYQTRVHTPLFPLEFFEQLYHTSFSRFLLVRYQGRIVGGTVCVEQPGKAVYEWFACGEDGVHKSIYPSTLATYAGICYAASHGCPLFDMMGAGAPGDGGYGVRDFKAKFGGQLVEHGRYRCVFNRLLYGLGSCAVKVLKMK